MPFGRDPMQVDENLFREKVAYLFWCGPLDPNPHDVAIEGLFISF
jgi:hypothetical protein